MKKIYVLFTLMVLSLVQAQESFPFMRPGLLKGTDVKVVDSNSSEYAGYFEGFYTDSNLRKIYMPDNVYDFHSDREKLLNTEFHVVDVDTIKTTGLGDNNQTRLTLKDKTGNTVYYEYKPTYEIDYPFEVIGGLKLPPDFYCDYFKYNKNRMGATMADAGISCTVEKIEKLEDVKGDAYTILFTLFAPTNAGIYKEFSLFLEDGTVLKIPSEGFAEFSTHTTSYRYAFGGVFYHKNLAALRKSKIKKIKIGSTSWDYKDGARLTNILNCSNSAKLKK